MPIGRLQFHHVAVPVTDVARACAFYESVLGLTPIPRPSFDFAGQWYDLGNGQQLHLIRHPQARALRHTDAIDGRDAHFALRAADYRQALAALEALGIPHRAQPQSITGWAQIFLTDPDGNVIEFNAPRP